MRDLDTILFMPELCREDAGTNGLTVSTFEDEILINYYNPYLHGDTINFTVLDLKDKTFFKYSRVVKGFGKARDEIQSIALNKNYIAFVTDKQIYFFEKGSADNQYIIIMNDNFEEIFFTSDNTLLLSRCYNFFSPDNKNYAKVKLCAYDITAQKYIRCIEPHITNIALTHMEPLQLISAANNQVVVGQNENYHFDCYDGQLNYKQTQTKTFTDWHPIDSAKLDKLTKMSKGDITPLLQFLQPKFLSGYSLCNQYTFVDENTLLVEYTLGNNSADTSERLTNVWRRSSDKWTCSDTIYRSVAFNNMDSSIISNVNYDNNLWWFFKTVYSANYSIVFFKGSGIYPVGMYRNDFMDKTNQYFSKQDPIINMVVLKRKY